MFIAFETYFLGGKKVSPHGIQQALSCCSSQEESTWKGFKAVRPSLGLLKDLSQ